MWFDNKIVKPDGFENYSGSSFDNNAPGWQSLNSVAILKRYVNGNAFEAAIIKSTERSKDM